MSIRSRLASLPPKQILMLHAQRLASVGPVNWHQRRAMAKDQNPKVANFANVLASDRPADLEATISAIENYRSYLATAEAAERYNITPERATNLALIGSKTPRWAKLIADLVTALQPMRVLEMGTAVGISGAYIAAALVENQNGELTTIEGHAKNYTMAVDTFAELKLSETVVVVNGTFEATLDELLQTEPLFDLVFKDGDHTEDATVEWFNTLVPKLAPHAAFLFDDIRRDHGMKRAWDKILQHQNVDASIDFFGMGLVFLTPKRQGTPRHYRYGVR